MLAVSQEYIAAWELLCLTYMTHYVPRKGAGLRRVAKRSAHDQPTFLWMLHFCLHVSLTSQINQNRTWQTAPCTSAFWTSGLHLVTKPIYPDKTTLLLDDVLGVTPCVATGLLKYEGAPVAIINTPLILHVRTGCDECSNEPSVLTQWGCNNLPKSVVGKPK